MELIHNLSDLRENLSTLESYMNSGDDSDREFHRELIKKGICFIAYRKGDRYLFAPSRFVGYQHNSMRSHIDNDSRDGRETNPAICNVLHEECQHKADLNSLYQGFCDELGFAAKETGSFGIERKFWRNLS